MGWFVGILIFLLNLFDGVSTYFILDTGNSRELNPLVNWAITNMGGWFLLPKILIGFIAGIAVIVNWERFKVARVGGLIVVAVYGSLVLYHVVVLCIFY